MRREQATGVTIQRMVHDMDAGDIILQRSTPIGEAEDAQDVVKLPAGHVDALFPGGDNGSGAGVGVLFHHLGPPQLDGFQR